jgi:hypothetical protein
VCQFVVKFDGDAQARRHVTVFDDDPRRAALKVYLWLRHRMPRGDPGDFGVVTACPVGEGKPYSLTELDGDAGRLTAGQVDEMVKEVERMQP